MALLARSATALVLTVIALAAASPAASAADIGGTWDLPSGSVAKQEWTFTSGTGTLAGEGKGGSYTWPMEGTLSGNAVQVKTAYRNSGYVAYFVGTVSPDGNTMSGTWSTGGYAAAQSSSSTWVANRRAGSGPNPPGGGQRTPTATQVMCNFIVATDRHTCFVTVGDATGKGVVPTGTVTLSSGNGGHFPLGKTCALKGREGSVGVASCDAEYMAPKNKPLEVTAVYGGDATHASSSGKTRFLLAPPGSGAYLPTIMPFDPPTLKFDLKNPKKGSKITTTATLTDDLGVTGTCDGSAATASLAAARKRKPVVPRSKRKGRSVSVVSVRRNAPKGKVKVRLRFRKKALLKAFPSSRRVQLVVRVRIKPKRGRAIVVVKSKTIKLTVKRRNGKAVISASPAPTAHASQDPDNPVATYVGGNGCGMLTISVPKAQRPLTAYISWPVTLSCQSQNIQNRNIQTVTTTLEHSAELTARGDNSYSFTASGQGFSISGVLLAGSGSLSGGISVFQIIDGEPYVCTAQVPASLSQTS